MHGCPDTSPAHSLCLLLFYVPLALTPAILIDCPRGGGDGGLSLKLTKGNAKSADGACSGSSSRTATARTGAWHRPQLLCSAEPPSHVPSAMRAALEQTRSRAFLVGTVCWPLAADTSQWSTEAHGLMINVAAQSAQPQLGASPSRTGLCPEPRRALLGCACSHRSTALPWLSISPLALPLPACTWRCERAVSSRGCARPAAHRASLPWSILHSRYRLPLRLLPTPLQYTA